VIFLDEWWTSSKVLKIGDRETNNLQSTIYQLCGILFVNLGGEMKIAPHLKYQLVQIYDG